MKQLVIAALVAAGISGQVFAQAPPAPQPGGLVPPPPGAPAPLPPAGQPGLQQVSTYSGTVAKLVANDDYVYDGFYFMNNGDSLLVKFPPHLGSRIMSALKAGSSVSVKGVANTNPEGKKEVRMMSITANGSTISDTATALPATPPAETSVSGKATLSSFQKDKEGRINGFILSNNIILKLPPEAASQLGALVSSGADIAYTGMQKPANNGEAYAANYKIVHARTITVNGKEYML